MTETIKMRHPWIFSSVSVYHIVQQENYLLTGTQKK